MKRVALILSVVMLMSNVHVNAMQTDQVPKDTLYLRITNVVKNKKFIVGGVICAGVSLIAYALYKAYKQQEDQVDECEEYV